MVTGCSNTDDRPLQSGDCSQSFLSVKEKMRATLQLYIVNQQREVRESERPEVRKTESPRVGKSGSQEVEKIVSSE